tara:strand:- start:525 stop:779 length:255 start_codon:yes stop_codon:yes gene_type:complete
MEACIVVISVMNSNARKVCEAIENQKFDSRESAIETIKAQLDDCEGGVSIFRLTDFMDEVNNQELDNLQFSFISYIHINLDLSN